MIRIFDLNGSSNSDFKGLLMMSQILHNRWTKTVFCLNVLFSSHTYELGKRFPNPSYFETLKHVSTHDTNLILDMYLIRHHSFDKLLMQHKIDSINCITSCTYKKMRMLNLTQSVTYKWKKLPPIRWMKNNVYIKKGIVLSTIYKRNRIYLQSAITIKMLFQTYA